MNADRKHCRSSAFMGVHLRPWLIFSHLAALSYPSHHLEPVSAKACLGESVLKPACVNRFQNLLDHRQAGSNSPKEGLPTRTKPLARRTLRVSESAATTES